MTFRNFKISLQLKFDNAQVITDPLAATAEKSAGPPDAGQPRRPHQAHRASSLVRRHWIFAVLFTAGLGLRVITQMAYRPALFYIDSYKYLTGTSGYDPEGYRFLLAPILWVGNLAVVPAFQHLLGLAMGLAVYVVLIRRGAPRWTGALAAAPVLLDAYQLQMEQTIMPDVVFEALILGGLHPAVEAPAQPHPDPRRRLGAGAGRRRSPGGRAADHPGGRVRGAGRLGRARPVAPGQVPGAGRSVLRDAVRLFALTRDGVSTITPISRWQFQPAYATFPPGVTLPFVARQAQVYGGGPMTIRPRPRSCAIISCTAATRQGHCWPRWPRLAPRARCSSSPGGGSAPHRPGEASLPTAPWLPAPCWPR